MVNNQSVVTDLGHFREKGSIEIDDCIYQIEKEGLIGSHWLVTKNGSTIIETEKTNWFGQTWELRYQSQTFHLRPIALFKQGLMLVKNDRELLRINRKHPFTRRSVLTVVDQNIQPELIGFAFWLACVIWRRRAAASSS